MNLAATEEYIFPPFGGLLGGGGEEEGFILHTYLLQCKSVCLVLNMFV